VEIVFFEEKTTIKIYPNPIISDIVIQLPVNMVNNQIMFTVINDIGQKLSRRKYSMPAAGKKSMSAC